MIAGVEKRGYTTAHLWCSACGQLVSPGMPYLQRNGVFAHVGTHCEVDIGRLVGRQGASVAAARGAGARRDPARAVRVEDIEQRAQLSLMGVG